MRVPTGAYDVFFPAGRDLHRSAGVSYKDIEDKRDIFFPVHQVLVDGDRKFIWLQVESCCLEFISYEVSRKDFRRW